MTRCSWRGLELANNQCSDIENKIQIFLTDQARSRAGSNNVIGLSKQVMLAVSPFYSKPESADGFRKAYGFTSKHTAGLDSGGFQFLMGNLDLGEPQILPCGVKVPTSARATIDLYKRIGVEKHDYPIQLDLPPRFNQEPEVRKQLIERSVGYYYEMAQEIPWTLPVVHGWTVEEMKYNLELLENPEKAELAMGTFLTEMRGNWTMGNLNPHKPKGELALGTYKALHNSENYLPYTDNPANKDRVALGTYKGLTHGINYKKYVQGAAIATPMPGLVDVGIKSPSNLPMVAVRKVALGTFVASATGGLGEKLAVGTYAATGTKPINEMLKRGVIDKPRRIGYQVIIDRIALALNLLKEDYDVFMLGGASPHMIHQCFLAGSNWTDTSAWRIKALMAEIYLWGHSSGDNAFCIGYSRKNRLMDEEGKRILKEYLSDPTHPFNGMAADRFLAIGKMRMPEWKETWPKEQWEEKPFRIRALHNAWFLKQIVEPTAKEYATNPDGYYGYLKRCLANRPILSKRLTGLMDKLRRPYVQTDLSVYLK